MKKTAIFLIVAALMSQTCYADSIDIVEYDRLSQKVKVTGSYSNVDIFKPMFVMKINDGNNKLNLMTQCDKVESEGKFSFEIPLDGETGEYTIVVNSNAFDNALTKRFDYYSSEDIQKVIDKIDSDEVDTLSKFTAVINDTDNFPALGLDKGLNDTLSDTADIYKNMFAAKPFKSYESFLTEYYKNAVEMLVYENKNPKYSVAMLEKHEKETGITDETSYEDYTLMTASEKQLLVSKIAGLKEENDFEKSFNEAVVLTKVKTANTHGDTGAMLMKYKDIVYRDDISAYFSSNNTQAVNLFLTGNDYKSITELQDAILTKLKSGGKGSGTSSSSSSSSGGSSYTGIPAPSANNNASVGSIESKTVYCDIDDVEWAKNAIYALSDKGILNGVGEGMFAPNNSVKREEFVKILVEAFNVNTDVNANVNFSDVQKGAWYEKYINAGVNTKVINGIGNNMFGIGRTITRQDMAVMAYRFACSVGYEFKNSASIDNFSDRAVIGDYAKEAISALYSESIITGMSNSTFEPNATATRAQAAVMVYRLLQFTEGGQK